MLASLGLACCLCGKASLAQSEIDIDSRLSAAPLALDPTNSDPRYLIDFTSLAGPAEALRQRGPAQATDDPGVDPVKSLQAIATRWLNVTNARTPTIRALQPERPVILETTHSASGVWPMAGLRSSLERWLPFAPRQATIGTDRLFLPTVLTEGSGPLGAAATTGEVDLIVFDVALTPDGQALRLKDDRPPTIITAALGGAGSAVGASSSAVWAQGLGAGTSIASSAWRPPSLATKGGHRTVAGLTASLGDWQPAREQLIVLQGLTSQDSALLHNLALQTGSPSIPGAELYAANLDQGRQATVEFDDGWLFANRMTLPVGRLDLSGPADNRDGGRIAFIPFIDTGRGWNTQIPAAINIYDPWSIGVGIGWQMTDRTGVRLGVDTPLNGADLPESTDPEDFGLQLRLATEFGK